MPPKGKDISALSASNAAQAAQAPAAAAPVPAAAPVTTVAPVKKGKDFARMAPPPQQSVAPPAATQAVTTTTTSNTSSVLYGGGRSKGKDLSRMGGGPSAPAPSVSSSTTSTAAPYSSTLGAAAPVQAPVPNNMEQRHEIARRKAYGLDASNNPSNIMRSPPLGYQNYSQPIGQHRPLVPNASQPLDIKVAKAKQPTKRPSHAESRLSSAKTDDKYGNPSLAPAIGMKLQKLCHSIDPSYTLDSEVQERLVEMADSFVEKVTKDAVRLARHRGSSRLDVVDVALALKKGYNISVPGLGPPQRGVASMSSVGSTAAAGNQFGGWLFADRVTVPAEGGAKKKRRTSNSGAT